jgi:hypothetical protein
MFRQIFPFIKGMEVFARHDPGKDFFVFGLYEYTNFKKGS